MAKIFKKSPKEQAVWSQTKLSHPSPLLLFFFGGERARADTKLSASEEKKNIRFQVFIRNIRGTNQRILPPAVAAGAGALLSPRESTDRMPRGCVSLLSVGIWPCRSLVTPGVLGWRLLCPPCFVQGTKSDQQGLLCVSPAWAVLLSGGR